MKLNRALAKDAPRLLPSLQIIRSRLAARHSLVIDAKTPSGRLQRLLIEVRGADSLLRVRETARRLKAAAGRQGYPMIAATFLSPRMRELCRQEGIGFVDLAGNCFVQTNDVYLEKIVERNPFPPRGRPASLFTPVSSRVIRALLEDPSRAWQVQELAREAEVSLGQASNTCRRLLEQSYIERAQRRLSVGEPAKLLEAWREAYTAVPRAAHGFFSLERDPQRLMRRIASAANARRFPYALTSFAAASLIAPFVHGIGIVQWYITDELALDAWVQALDLRPVDAGANALIHLPHDAGVLYGAHPVQGMTVVGNIQLYLDLSIEGGRGAEQAEFLREKALDF